MPEDIGKITIPFDVPKLWIASENIDPVTIKLNEYYKGVWNPLAEKVGEDVEYIHYSTGTEGLSIFAITGVKKMEAYIPAPSPAIWVGGVMDVMLLIAAIAGMWYIKKRVR
ncbi:MAG: PGF-pre-PGF domain-containing protein [Methanophagales archaeon]|nr:PGF-pre-PGF domain-containing protein [Methanophagales archaeon]